MLAKDKVPDPPDPKSLCSHCGKMSDGQYPPGSQKRKDADEKAGIDPKVITEKVSVNVG